MSLTVTSSPAKAASAMPQGGSDTGAMTPPSGGFAALLSGELFNLLSIPGNDVPGTSIEKLDIDPKDLIQTKEEPLTEIDPSLMASIAAALQQRNAQPMQTTDRMLTTPLSARQEITRDVSDLAFNNKKIQADTTLASSEVDMSNTAPALDSLKTVPIFGRGLPDIPTIDPEAANSAGEKSTPITPTALIPDYRSVQTNNAAIAPDQSEIRANLRESGWSQHLGDKVVWLAKNEIQTAQININPPELGPMQITLNLNGDQAKILFSSPHAEVRQAIENALPQLKEMLSTSGISLGQADVGAQFAQQNRETPYQQANGKRGADENAILLSDNIVASTSSGTVLQQGRGLVDLFA